MGESTHPTVEFGTRGGEIDVPVIGQPHAYLVRLLEEYMERASGLEMIGALLDGASPAEGLGLLATAGDSLVYDLLEKVLPDLPECMPKHKFAGFRTREAYNANEYDKEHDQSPSFAQIEEAFKVAARINRLDVLKTLYGAIKGVIDPKDLEELRAEISGWIGSTLKSSVHNLQSSPGTNGTAHPNGSGEALRTAAAGDTPEPSRENGLTPVTSSGPLQTT